MALVSTITPSSSSSSSSSTKHNPSDPEQQPILVLVIPAKKHSQPTPPLHSPLGNPPLPNHHQPTTTTTTPPSHKYYYYHPHHLSTSPSPCAATACPTQRPIHPSANVGNSLNNNSFPHATTTHTNPMSRPPPPLRGSPNSRTHHSHYPSSVSETIVDHRSTPHTTTTTPTTNTPVLVLVSGRSSSTTTTSYYQHVPASSAFASSTGPHQPTLPPPLSSSPSPSPSPLRRPRVLMDYVRASAATSPDAAARSLHRASLRIRQAIAASRSRPLRSRLPVIPEDFPLASVPSIVRASSSSSRRSSSIALPTPPSIGPSQSRSRLLPPPARSLVSPAERRPLVPSLAAHAPFRTPRKQTATEWAESERSTRASAPSGKRPSEFLRNRTSCLAATS